MTPSNVTERPVPYDVWCCLIACLLGVYRNTYPLRRVFICPAAQLGPTSSPPLFHVMFEQIGGSQFRRVLVIAVKQARSGYAISISTNAHKLCQGDSDPWIACRCQPLQPP